MSQHIVIIGGGISGTATAYELAKRGARVTLLERGDLASMASGWTLAGVRQSGRHPAELPLAEAAVARWQTLDAELDADTEYRQQGNLRLALEPEQVETIRGVVETGNAAGIAMTFLDSAVDVRQIAPLVAGEVHAASYCATDGHANPTKTVRAFAAAATRAGATIRTGAEVLAITTVSDRVTGVQLVDETLAADVVVVLAGTYTPQLIAPLGLDLPLRLTHVPAVQTVPMEPMLEQVIGIATGRFAGRQQVDGRFRLTVGNIPWPHERHDADNVQPTLAQVEDTIASTLRILPGIGDIRVAKVWGGLIDHTPDAIPVIERSPDIEGLVIGAGFSGHGFCLGPITGAICADLALTGETEYPIAPFTLSRFVALSGVGEAPQLHG